MAHDAIGAHSRDELGISATLQARPVQAAVASAASVAAGAALPLAVAVVVRGSALLPWLSVMSLLFLALLGATAARAGGAGVLVGAWRVTFWGALAIGITAGLGALFGAVV
jgi:VIT1/CCC1 family predicted Fe2+/Mn2+ transporter